LAGFLAAGDQRQRAFQGAIEGLNEKQQVRADWSSARELGCFGLKRDTFVVRLSIVILHLDTPEFLEKTLLSVLPDRGAEDEVLVVRARPYADPYHLAEEVRFLETPGAGWAEAANEGLRAAQAPLVHLLQSGVESPPAGFEQALGHFADPRIAAVSPRILDAQSPQRSVGAGWTLTDGGRIRQVHIWTPKQKHVSDGPSSDSVANTCPDTLSIPAPDPSSVIFRKELALAWGGFHKGWTPRGAWLEMGLAMTAAGFRLVVEPGWTAQIPRNFPPGHSAGQLARDAERLFWQWTPRPISLGRLIRHGAAVVGEWLASGPTPSALARIVGRAAGLLQGIRMEPGRSRASRLFRPFRKPSLQGSHGRASDASGRTGLSMPPIGKQAHLIFQK